MPTIPVWVWYGTGIGQIRWRTKEFIAYCSYGMVPYYDGMADGTKIKLCTRMVMQKVGGTIRFTTIPGLFTSAQLYVM